MRSEKGANISTSNFKVQDIQPDVHVLNAEPLKSSSLSKTMYIKIHRDVRY
jgi:hypothetical protein